ncbi:hypothetical protein CN233_18760 [Sinorhizobium meliloti]|uniref:hypothetical protein n=1 Tax=Rhizobium meliloti TaxID=382 RepID=UPI000FDA7367|nr:hypothetical protein [Sinorhizobium meliloti]MDX0213877.1 hypothetical protein [Sinorhizobium meliloti]RVG29514.1 hypothetical protein CN233_18760 [Sinorhizobium meliloti]
MTIDLPLEETQNLLLDYICRTGPLGRYLRLERHSFLGFAAHAKGVQFVEEHLELAEDGGEKSRAFYLGLVKPLLDKSVSDFPEGIMQMVDKVYGGEKIGEEEIRNVLCIRSDDEDDVWEIVRLLSMPAIQDDFMADFLNGVDDAWSESEHGAVDIDEDKT